MSDDRGKIRCIIMYFININRFVVNCVGRTDVIVNIGVVMCGFM
jgi:hypothetical protein